MGQEPRATRDAKRNSEAEEGPFFSWAFGPGFLIICVSLTDIVKIIFHAPLQWFLEFYRHGLGRGVRIFLDSFEWLKKKR
jgi:hypothetical protein